MIVGALPKFEHQTITISVQVSAYSTNHVIDIYVYIKVIEQKGQKGEQQQHL